MFKRFLFLAVSVATTSAVDYRVQEHYSDSACTIRTGESSFTKKGCSCRVEDTRVAGGYTTTLYSDIGCTGAVVHPPHDIADESCQDTQTGLYKTTSWKTSLPVTAADVPKGKLLVLHYGLCMWGEARCDKTSEYYGGSYYDMDTCLWKGTSSEYKLTRNPSKPNEILKTRNCTVPGTPVPYQTLNQCLNTVEAGYGHTLAILGGDTEMSGAASTAPFCALLASLSVMTSIMLA